GRSMVRWLSCISCRVTADAPGDRLYLTLGQRVSNRHVQPCQVVGYVLFIRSGTAQPACNGGHRHVALPFRDGRDLPRQRHLGGGTASWCPRRWHDESVVPPDVDALADLAGAVGHPEGRVLEVQVDSSRPRDG